MVVKQGSSVKATQILSYTDAAQSSGFDFSEDVYMSGSGTLTAYFYLYEDGEQVGLVPTVSTHNIACTEIISAQIGTVALDATLQAANPD